MKTKDMIHADELNAIDVLSIATERLSDAAATMANSKEAIDKCGSAGSYSGGTVQGCVTTCQTVAGELARLVEAIRDRNSANEKEEGN